MNDHQEQRSSAEQLRIGLLYSFAPHFKQAAAALREQYPEAHITALVPPDFPEAAVCGVVDRQETCAPAPGGKRGLGEALRLARVIRTARFDVFVVLFDSPRLQALAAISGATRRFWYGLDAALHPLQIRIATACAKLLCQRIRGTLTYWRIWLHIRCTRIQPVAQHDSRAKNQERK